MNIPTSAVAANPPWLGPVSHSDTRGRFLFETDREKLARTEKQLQQAAKAAQKLLSETIRRLVEIGLRATGK